MNKYLSFIKNEINYIKYKWAKKIQKLREKKN